MLRAPPTPSPTPERSHTRALAAVLLVGLLLRMLGIGWGLPSARVPGEPPFHPDELVPYEEGGSLYTAPDAITFTWGGAFYFRVAWVVRALGDGLHPGDSFAATHATVAGLRLVSALVGVLSALAIHRTARLLYGRRAGLLAAFLFLAFPAHVLESHYARPDVIQVGLSCVALACAATVATRHSPRVLAWSVAGGLAAGLAIATMIWGVLALVPLALAVAIAQWRGSVDRRYLTGVATIGLAIAGATALGYLLGSVETFLFWDTFLEGRERAALMHGSTHYHAPTALLGGTALFAFGTLATVSAYGGAVLTVARRTPAARWIVVAALAAGAVLLGMLEGQMLRYVLFLAPEFAVLAGGALDEAIERASSGLGARRAAAWLRPVAYAAVAAAALQASLAYVVEMHFADDARYRTGRWIAQHAPEGARVGITPSFYGDWTYVPRFADSPARGVLRIEELMLRENFDASGYLARGLDFIALSDATASGVSGPTATRFVDELVHGNAYRAVARIGPLWHPLCSGGRAGAPLPGDLLYLRQTFTVYERADRVARLDS